MTPFTCVESNLQFSKIRHTGQKQGTFMTRVSDGFLFEIVELETDIFLRLNISPPRFACQIKYLIPNSLLLSNLRKV